MVARASRLRSFGLPQKPQAGRSRHHGKASFETHSQRREEQSMSQNRVEFEVNVNAQAGILELRAAPDGQRTSPVESAVYVPPTEDGFPVD